MSATLGVPIDDLLSDLELGSTLGEAERRIPQHLAHWLWEQFAVRTQDDLFGVHAAESTRHGPCQIVDYLIRNASSLEAALQAIAEYARLTNDGMQGQLLVRADQATLSWTILDTPAGPPRQLAEFMVVSWLVLLREFTQQPLKPILIRFQHPEPAYGEQLREFLGCALEFHAASTNIVFPARVLTLPIVGADQDLFGLLKGYAELLVAKLPEQSGLINRVRHILANSLRSGQASVAQTSKTLHMSSRTLQRRLKEMGTTHEVLLDEMRQRFAVRYLRETSVSPGELSYLLGFADPSTFYRAFRRWTGMTPVAYRRSGARSQSGIEFKGESMPKPLEGEEHATA